MKRVILAILLIIVLIPAVILFLLFTQPGNNLIKPFIEKKIDSSLKTNLKLTRFTLRPSFVNIVLSTPYGSTLTIKGNFNAFIKGINAHYRMDVSATERMLRFNNYTIRGPFWIAGHIKGLMKKVIVIKGKSNFADSSITYTVVLTNTEPYSVSAIISHLELKKLFNTLNMEPVADGILQANIQLNSFKKNALKGTANVKIEKGELNQDLFKKRYGVIIPAPTFTSTLNILMNGSIVNFIGKINSAPIAAFLKGSFDQNREAVKADYNINIHKLGILKPLIHMPIRGSLYTNGTVVAKNGDITVQGSSNFAGSATSYRFHLNKQNSKTVSFKTDHLMISKLLYMLYQPPYVKGALSAKGDFSIAKNISGNLALMMKNGTIIGSTIKRLYKIDMPNTPFKAALVSNMSDLTGVARFTFNSTLANLTSKDLKYNIKELTANGHYRLVLPDLNRLRFVTNRPLKGSITVTGALSFNKTLYLTAHSNTLGGTIDVVFKNNRINGSAKSIKVVKLTDMLEYKRIFDSTGDVTFNYDLLTKKGSVNANFVNGHILPNKLTFLLSTMAKFDITREIYKTTHLVSIINNKLIVSNLDMISRFTHILSKNAVMDLAKNRIDATLEIYIKKRPIKVKIRGDLNHPKIKIDLRGLIKHKIEKKLKKKLQKELLKKGLLNKLNKLGF